MAVGANAVGTICFIAVAGVAHFIGMAAAAFARRGGIVAAVGGGGRRAIGGGASHTSRSAPTSLAATANRLNFIIAMAAMATLSGSLCRCRRRLHRPMAAPTKPNRTNRFVATAVLSVGRCRAVVARRRGGGAEPYFGAFVVGAAVGFVWLGRSGVAVGHANDGLRL